MSYCRFSTPIPELSPDVDLSMNKMLELLSGGYSVWKAYLKNNDVKTSDFYVYESCYGGYQCHCAKKEDVWFETPSEMADYLQECKNNGELVPQSAIDALYEEA